MECLNQRELKRIEYKNRRFHAIWFQRNPNKPTMTAQVSNVGRLGYLLEIHDTASPNPFKPVLKAILSALSEAMKSTFDHFGS